MIPIKPFLGFLRTLVRILDRFFPTIALTPPLPASNISRDEDMVTAYDNDPLVYRGRMRIRTGVSMMDSMKRIREQLNQLTIPICIAHGGDDKITPISGSQYVFEHTQSADKEFAPYPNMRHEVHNEIDREIFLQELLTWLNGHTGTAQAS